MSIFNKDNFTRAAIVLTLVAGSYVGYFLFSEDSANVEPVESEQPEPITDNTQFEDPEEVVEPEPEAPQKQPAPSPVVVETPAVYTSYGHSPEKPLPIGQATSTSCTTDAGVECYIVFSNGEQEITFDPKTTDADGGAVWSWTGGSEVTTGTWKVTAIAGDKMSLEETIYVE